MMNRMRIHAQVSQEYLNRAIITRGLYILNPLFEGQIDYTFTLNYIQESTGNKHYNFKMEISRIDHCDTAYKAHCGNRKITTNRFLPTMHLPSTQCSCFHCVCFSIDRS